MLFFHRHSGMLINNIFSLMTYAGIPNINKETVKLFEERLFLNLDADASKDVNESNKMLIEKINSDYDSWWGWAIDKYHGREH